MLSMMNHGTPYFLLHFPPSKCKLPLVNAEGLPGVFMCCGFFHMSCCPMQKVKSATLFFVAILKNAVKSYTV